MKNLVFKSLESGGLVALEGFALVNRANLKMLLSLLNPDQEAQILSHFGVHPPNMENVLELSTWASEAIKCLGIKQSDLAREAGVNPCDVSYLINKDARLAGQGRKEKIISKLLEKLEVKFLEHQYSKSS